VGRCRKVKSEEREKREGESCWKSSLPGVRGGGECVFIPGASAPCPTRRAVKAVTGPLNRKGQSTGRAGGRLTEKMHGEQTQLAACHCISADRG
jgi:hypothetical protein